MRTYVWHQCQVSNLNIYRRVIFRRVIFHKKNPDEQWADIPEEHLGKPLIDPDPYYQDKNVSFRHFKRVGFINTGRRSKVGITLIQTCPRF